MHTTTQHPLTLKARALLAKQAVLDVALLETLNAIIANKVYAADGYSSSHTYCVQALAMSDDSAARRMKAADLLRRYPVLVRPMIERRELHLTGLARLHGVINDSNVRELLNEARGKTKREVEAIVLRMDPRSSIRSVVARVPAARIVIEDLDGRRADAAEESSERMRSVDVCEGSSNSSRGSDAHAEADALLHSTPSRTVLGRSVEVHVRSMMKPVEMRAPNVYAFRALMDEETHVIYERVKDLAPDKDPTVILRRALRALLTELESKKERKLKRTESGKTSDMDALLLSTTDDDEIARADREAVSEQGSGTALELREPTGEHEGSTQSSTVVLGTGCWVGPRGRRRYIDAATIREVYERDGGRCTFVGNGGHVCGTTRSIQMHHREAFARGGSNAASNLTLHCKTHNLYQGELDFGPRPAA